MIDFHIDFNKAFSHPPPPWPMTRTFLFSVSPHVAYQQSTVRYWWIITQPFAMLPNQHTFLFFFFESPSWITFQFVLVQYQCCHADSPHCFLMHSDMTAVDERSHYEAWIMEDRYLISEGVLAGHRAYVHLVLSFHPSSGAFSVPFFPHLQCKMLK